MRYCNNCGSPMEDENRFCTKCGADNGAVQEMQGGASTVAAEASKLNISAFGLFHIAGVLMFAIAALIQLVACCKNAEAVTVYTSLFREGIIISAIYFVFGMWMVIPAMLFILNLKDTGKNGTVGAAVVAVVLIIAAAVVNAILKNSVGVAGALEMVMQIYVKKISSVIVFCVLSAAAGIIATRKDI